MENLLIVTDRCILACGEMRNVTVTEFIKLRIIANKKACGKIICSTCMVLRLGQMAQSMKDY